MASVSMPPTSLQVTLDNAIAFLIRPLVFTHPTADVLTLKAALESNLTQAFAFSWFPNEPSHGSGRRCLTLSPACAPPKPIYASCLASGIQWHEWMAVLGNAEFDLFVDPGRVAVRLGGMNPQVIDIWTAPIPAPVVAQPRPRLDTFKELKIQAQLRQQLEEPKTFEQELAEDDELLADELLQMVNNKVSDPTNWQSTWMTPIVDQFPKPPSRSASPLSVISSHSRSSTSSRALSDYSFADTVDSFGTFTTMSSAASVASGASKEQSSPAKLSRRERARQARVFVDKSRKEITPYDGGKTTVLTGGVMLGAPKKTSSAPKSAPKNPGNAWRARV